MCVIDKNNLYVVADIGEPEISNRGLARFRSASHLSSTPHPTKSRI